MKLFRISLISCSLVACTTLKYEASSIQEFMELSIPKITKEYSRFIKNDFYFKGNGIAKLSYNQDGKLEGCAIETDSIPQKLQENICNDVFAKINFKDGARVNLPLDFKSTEEK